MRRVPRCLQHLQNARHVRDGNTTTLVALVRVLSTLDLRYEENNARRKWNSPVDYPSKLRVIRNSLREKVSRFGLKVRDFEERHTEVVEESTI